MRRSARARCLPSCNGPSIGSGLPRASTLMFKDLTGMPARSYGAQSTKLTILNPGPPFPVFRGTPERASHSDGHPHKIARSLYC